MCRLQSIERSGDVVDGEDEHGNNSVEMVSAKLGHLSGTKEAEVLTSKIVEGRMRQFYDEVQCSLFTVCSRCQELSEEKEIK